MAARVISAAIIGIDAAPVVVEVDVASGLRAFSIVGLPDNAVKESKERIVAALKNIGVKPPSQLAKRVTVNLAPADTKKQGPSYDLPIALGFLLASEQIKAVSPLSRTLVMGELSLDGRVRPVRGVLPAVMMAKAKGLKQVIVPLRNAAEAGLIEGLRVYGAATVRQVLDHVSGDQPLAPFCAPAGRSISEEAEPILDFRFISGQILAKRALEIAAAGGHNVLFHGPPGAGKTLLARALPGIMPELTNTEALEVTRIYSASGQALQGLMRTRPFRNPHHQTSPAAVLGGGPNPMPGEVTFAHHGVLFLDELPEFRRDVIEGLRQPLEEGVVHVARTQGRATFPAQFLLVAAMNPCPCGYAGDAKVQCRCSAYEVEHYQRKVSGPILDRFDLHVHVPRLTKEELMSATDAEPSIAIRDRVAAARQRQAQRFKQAGLLNGRIEGKNVPRYCQTDESGQALLAMAIDGYALSARGYHKVLKVARTIADLSQSDIIKRDHISEALQYRQPVNPRM